MFICSDVCLFSHLFVHSLDCSVVCLFSCLLVKLFVGSVVCWFSYLLVQLFVRLGIRLFSHLFVQSFACSRSFVQMFAQLFFTDSALWAGSVIESPSETQKPSQCDDALAGNSQDLVIDSQK